MPPTTRCGRRATGTRGELNLATVSSGRSSTFAAEVKAGRWPNPEALDQVAEAHEQQATQLRNAGEASYQFTKPHLVQVLVGEAGTAQLAAHDANVDLWDTHADLYEQSGRAVRNAAAELRGLQHDLRLLIEDNEPKYETALENSKGVAAQRILTATLSEADGMVADRAQSASKYVQAVNFTVPLPQGPAPDPDGQASHHGNDKPPHDKQNDPDAAGQKGGDKDDESAASHAGAQPQRDVQGDVPPGTTASQADNTSASPSRDVQTDLPPACPQPLPRSSQMPSLSPSQLGRSGSGGGSGGGSGMSGLSSAFKPPPSMGSSMPTSPASSMPSAPSVPSSSSSAASPMSSPGSSFQSGLASGMSAAGGGNSLSNMASPVSQQSVTQQGLSAHQVGGAPAFGSGPGGVPFSAPGGDAGVGGGPQGGAASGGSPAGGGTPMMPPAAMAGGAPLAPYSAPGAGPGTPGGGGAGTAPAAAAQSSSSAGSGVAAPGPVMAGGAGSTVSAPGVAAMAEINPDLLLAQRVLAGLVRGSERYPTLVFWAVSVLKMPMGSQVVIASNIGDGGYVPPDVFIPSTARLAVVDPVLPFGWAQRWMGCRHPAKALVDHFEHVGKRVAGVSLSALVTNEKWADTPAGVNDFLAMNHVDAMNMLAHAPVLDGGHQHRLAALDPVLAHRLSALVDGGYAPAWVSGQLTVAVIQAAQQREEVAGCKLVTADELNVLASVNRGTADEMIWKLYDQLADARHDHALVIPETHGIDDVDGSDQNRAVATLYQRYYQAGRIVEMVRWWKFNPPPVAEIAYCGIQAGFDSVVASVVSTLEMSARQRGGAA